MLSLDPAELAYLRARKPLKTRRLIWVKAKAFDTGISETMGLWTGGDHRDFVVEGETRTYFGAGNVLEIGNIPRLAGLEVRMLRVKLSPLSPEAQMLIRGYDVRLAPVEIHRVRFDAETDEQIAPPFRVWKGWIDMIDLKIPAEGETADCTVTIASNARAGTIPLTLKKSDASQKLRLLSGDRADRFFQYTDISGVVPVKWGEQ